MDFIKPKRIPEANIQAEIYRFCRNNNIKVCLEYKVENCRLDIVIVKHERIILIIETKSRKKEYPKNKRYKTKQINKYKKFEVPILVCASWYEIEQTCKEIKRMYESL